MFFILYSVKTCICLFFSHRHTHFFVDSKSVSVYLTHSNHQVKQNVMCFLCVVSDWEKVEIEMSAKKYALILILVPIFGTIKRIDSSIPWLIFGWELSTNFFFSPYGNGADFTYGNGKTAKIRFPMILLFMMLLNVNIFKSKSGFLWATSIEKVPVILFGSFYDKNAHFQFRLCTFFYSLFFVVVSVI